MVAAIEIGSLNETGKRRNNEDSIYPLKDHATIKDNLFIVCDGVGGENKGEVASEIVCTSISHHIKNQENPLAEGRQAIEKAILYANQKLVEYAAKNVSARRMSTTMSLVLLGRQSIIAAWCGDTRIHHIRDGRILWKSEDHSLVQELVKRGEITAAEARSHPNKNIITRSLNALNTNNAVDFHEITDCINNDYFLLCTDGFLEQVDDNMLFSVLSNDQQKDKAKDFLALCEGKTKDNFSMYLIKVTDADSEPTKSQGRSSRPVLLTSLIVIIGIIIWLLIKTIGLKR